MTNVLVDTSVWVDHFRYRNDTFIELLTRGRVMAHPLVVGEIACGTPPNRAQTLFDLGKLPQPRLASVREVIDFIGREQLFGQGCGLVDLLLLASTLMTPETELWTLDSRLAAQAQRFGVMYQPTLH
ncbi:MAG: type II toxin-antitoxin system VapC family toxin [Azonexus sp.]|nr:type II toxin-antitoxin system VapC family toxin [Azonexus sp.]